MRHGGIDTPELDARLLLCHAAALTHEAYIASAREALQPAAAARLDAAIARRLKHEPVARITGDREFYGRSFRVDPNVLDPRPDTETLIEAALAIVDRQGWRGKPLRLLDLGTGTGCILITLLAELPRAQGIGTDKSPAALACAAANASRLGVGSRASFIAADWLAAASGQFELILSNPPYIASGEIAGLAADVAGYDPHLALNGGPDGLDAYRQIAAQRGRRVGRARAAPPRNRPNASRRRCQYPARSRAQAPSNRAGSCRQAARGCGRVVTEGRRSTGSQAKKTLGKPRCSG